MTVKQNLREYLLKHRIPLEVLAQACGCTVNRLKNEIFGGVRLSGDLYFDVCAGLSVSLDFFLKGQSELTLGGENANKKISV